MNQATESGPTARTFRALRTARGATLAYFATMVGLGLVNAVVGPTLPGIAEQTGVAVGGLGILFTARALGYMLSLRGAGRLLDWRPGQRWLAFGLLAAAAFSALMPLPGHLWLVLALTFGAGMGEAVVDVHANAMLAWRHGANAGAYFNALHFFYGVGTLVSPLLAALSLGVWGGIAPAYWLVGLLVLPIALGVTVPRAPAPPPPRAETQGAGRQGDEAADRLLVLLSMALLFLGAGAEVSVSGWLATFAVVSGQMDAPAAALLTAVFWGGFTIGRLSGVPLSTRMLPKSLLLLSLGLGLTGLSLLTLGVAWSVAPLLWAGSAVCGWGVGPLFATILAFAGRRMVLTGKLTGTLFIGASLGAMSTAPLTGLLMSRVHLLMLPAFVALLLLISTALVLTVVGLDARRWSPVGT